jgi:hypothetical protein
MRNGQRKCRIVAAWTWLLACTTGAGLEQTPQKARILVMLALTKTRDTKEIQRMFYTY